MTRRLRIAVRRFPPFERAITAQFADFVASTGIDAALGLEAFDLNPLHDAAIAGHGLRDGRFDIGFLATDWLAEAKALGAIADLTPHLAAEPIDDFLDAWSPSLIGLQRFDGGFWGMPYHDGPECLIYRKDLLAAAGLAVPTDWDAFHAASRVLHAPDQGRSGTVLALFPDGHNGFYDFCIQIWSRCGEPFDADGRPNFTSDAAVAGVDFLRGLARDSGAMAPGAHQLDSVASGMAFAAGKVAMMANWFGFAAYADTAAESMVRGKVDVAPLPSGPGGRSVSLNVFWVLAIGRGAADPALAWSFLRHCASAPMDRLTTIEGAIGTRRSTWRDPEINASIPYYHRLEWLHEHARSMPLTPHLAAYSHLVDEVMTAATTTDRPTRELLAEAQRRAERLG